MTDRLALRVVVLRVLVVSLLIALGGRLWYLQVLSGDHYRKVAESNRVRDVVTPATRGLVLDDNGRALVRNRTSLVISVDRSVVDRLPHAGRDVLSRLAPVIGVPFAELEQRIRFCTATVKPPCWNGSPYQPIPVATDVTDEQALAVIEHGDTFPGISADLQAVSQYPYGSLASHELGYLAPVTQDEIDKYGKQRGYHQNSLVGAAGLEATYDHYLRGSDGVKKLEVDRFGRVVSVAATTPPTSGDNLVLNLDANVQKATEQALAQELATLKAQGKSGTTASAVVLNAKTGGVVALASLPNYNPSVFTGGISEKDYQALTDPANGIPLLSRAYQGASAPGSTFKIVSFSTAVMKMNADLNGTYGCPATLQIGGQTFHNFEGESPGDVSLHQAIVVSCDTIFDTFAYNAWLADGGLRQGAAARAKAKEYFTTMAKEFGFGRQTGLDLPGEASGSVVDRADAQKIWDELKGSYCRRAKNGYPEVKDPATAERYREYAQEACTSGYLYNGGGATMFGIGQGQYLSVSPLQLAVAYAAVANGGTLLKPQLAKAIVSADGKVVKTMKPVVTGHLPVSAQALSYLRGALRGVASEPGGTATGVFGDFPPTVPVAGKTGTAEVEGKSDTSWFASFAPANDPQYVVVASFPDAGQGAVVAAPVVKQIYQAIYGVGKPAAFPGGKLPTALPRTNPDGTISPPATVTARRLSGGTGSPGSSSGTGGPVSAMAAEPPLRTVTTRSGGPPR
ncbi:MAG: penicillin-binding protein 2 [Frankia sp.]